MSSRINAARQSANHGEPRVSKLVGELFRRFRPVMGGAARACRLICVLAASSARKLSTSLCSTSKRNLVFVWFGTRRFFRRRAGLPALSGRLGPSWRPTSEQLHVLGHHAQARSLLSGLLVVPTVHL